MSIGISILAYGNEHIEECIKLLNQLDGYGLKFYITTDNPSSFPQLDNIVIVHTAEPFNYNLKRLGFRKALEDSDCVIMLDTDVYIKSGIDFSGLNDIKDGMYLRWQQICSKDTKLSSEIEYEYIDKVKEISGLPQLFFIDESTLVFKISESEIRTKLIEYWDMLYTETESIQPTYRYSGAVEGIMIYASVLKSGNSVKQGYITPFFSNIIHYKKYGELNHKKDII